MKKMITVETVQITVIRQAPLPPKIVWCELCAAEVAMLPLARAGELTGASELTICHLIEKGDLHFAETPEGKLLICSISLEAKTTVIETKILKV